MGRGGWWGDGVCGLWMLVAVLNGVVWVTCYVIGVCVCVCVVCGALPPQECSWCLLVVPAKHQLHQSALDLWLILMVMTPAQASWPFIPAWSLFNIPWPCRLPCSTLLTIHIRKSGAQLGLQVMNWHPNHSLLHVRVVILGSSSSETFGCMCVSSHQYVPESCLGVKGWMQCFLRTCGPQHQLEKKQHPPLTTNFKHKLQ